jgi:hypothetical protein
LATKLVGVTDLEDAKHVVAAVACNVQIIATRSLKGFASSSVPAKSPGRLLEDLGRRVRRNQSRAMLRATAQGRAAAPSLLLALACRYLRRNRDHRVAKRVDQKTMLS